MSKDKILAVIFSLLLLGAWRDTSGQVQANDSVRYAGYWHQKGVTPLQIITGDWFMVL